MKKLSAYYLFILAAFVLSFCTNNSSSTGQTGNEITEKTENKTTEIYSVSELIKNAEIYNDSSIAVKGIVDHICKHSDKRLKITDEETELRVELKGDLPAAKPAIVGKTIIVCGILKSEQMDLTMVKAWKVKKKLGHAGEEHTEHFKHEMAETDSILDLLQTGAISYYTRYHIDAISYETE